MIGAMVAAAVVAGFFGNNSGVSIVHIWLDESPRSGCWNMAIDDVALTLAVQRNIAMLRVYRWETATLSLGYFQATAAKRTPLQLPDGWSSLPVVRRISGGGAILHDQELTYAITLPALHPLARKPLELYNLVHNQVIELLAEIGFEARQRGAADVDADNQFLCFLRGDPRDVVSTVGGNKVLGSAQRRRKGAVLQHGSLLLRASPFSPEIPGLFDLGAKSGNEIACDETACDETACDETACDETELARQYCDRLARPFVTGGAVAGETGQVLPSEPIVFDCPFTDEDWRQVAELAATDYANLNPG